MRSVSIEIRGLSVVALSVKQTEERENGKAFVVEIWLE